VLSGQVVDTNGAWISEQLLDANIEIRERSVVGDARDDLVLAFTRAAAHAGLVLSTGGLGPTTDDLTAEAVAEAFDAPLVFDPVAWAQIAAHYERAGRVPPESNRKQALLPRGAVRLDNAFGTAPGFRLETPQAMIVCLPGPPRELKGMWATHLSPWLPQLAGSATPRVTLHTAGLSESWIQDQLRPVLAHAPAGCVFGTRAGLGVVAVKLKFAIDTPADARIAFVAEVQQALGRGVFAVDEGPGGLGDIPRLVRAVGDALRTRGQTLATAESCTGGGIAAACVAQPGTSAWFLEGIVAYANEAKQRRLGVAAEVIACHGAVSAEVACAMAEGARNASGADWALATTGIAGPDGGTPTKPVGTVHLAVAGPDGTTHQALHLSGGRDVVQARALVHGLHALWRRVETPTAPPPLHPSP
jgi:nicotinamide-nucleotide amidase